MEESFERDTAQANVEIITRKIEQVGERFFLAQLDADIFAALEARNYERARMLTIAKRERQEAEAKQHTKRDKS